MGKIIMILGISCLLTACDDGKRLPSRSQGIVCTADVKACSDGSYVSRNPDNNCEFDPCSSGEISGECNSDNGCAPVIRLPMQ